ncbi:hypothetical protein, partial [Stakelama marina]
FFPIEIGLHRLPLVKRDFANFYETAVRGRVPNARFWQMAFTGVYHRLQEDKMEKISQAELDQVCGGVEIMPISWSLPAGPGGSDVTLYGVGVDTGGGTQVGGGISEGGGTVGIRVTIKF